MCPKSGTHFTWEMSGTLLLHMMSQNGVKWPSSLSFLFLLAGARARARSVYRQWRNTIYSNARNPRTDVVDYLGNVWELLGDDDDHHNH